MFWTSNQSGISDATPYCQHYLYGFTLRELSFFHPCHFQLETQESSPSFLLLVIIIKLHLKYRAKKVHTLTNQILKGWGGAKIHRSFQTISSFWILKEELLRYETSFRICHKKGIKGDETIDDNGKMNDEGLLIYKLIMLFFLLDSKHFLHFLLVVWKMSTTS